MSTSSVDVRFRQAGRRREWFSVGNAGSAALSKFALPASLHLKLPAKPLVSTKPKTPRKFVIDSDSESSEEEEVEKEVEEEDDDEEEKENFQKVTVTSDDDSDSDGGLSSAFSKKLVLDDEEEDVPAGNIRSGTAAMYAHYNASVFEGRLPATLQIEWCDRLLTTAGTTVCSRSSESRLCTIQLSAKVVDSVYRLRRTLAHEMCHAAAWLLDGQCKPPHGAVFQKWASRFELVHGWTIKTCHSYEIRYAFQWQCMQCDAIVGRHSAKSVNPDKHLCGKCGGRLEELL